MDIFKKRKAKKKAKKDAAVLAQRGKSMRNQFKSSQKPTSMRTKMPDLNRATTEAEDFAAQKRRDMSGKGKLSSSYKKGGMVKSYKGGGFIQHD
tara:strand:+ start:330 stop:611 length:282 start_codon:yes stop_codon:yes gene_type:complete